MSDLAALITSIAGLITSVGGIVIGSLALTRGSPRERERAAKNALSLFAGGDDEPDDQDAAQWRAIDDLRRKLEG